MVPSPTAALMVTLITQWRRHPLAGNAMMTSLFYCWRNGHITLDIMSTLITQRWWRHHLTGDVTVFTVDVMTASLFSCWRNGDADHGRHKTFFVQRIGEGTVGSRGTRRVVVVLAVIVVAVADVGGRQRAGHQRVFLVGMVVPLPVCSKRDYVKNVRDTIQPKADKFFSSTSHFSLISVFIV